MRRAGTWRGAVGLVIGALALPSGTARAVDAPAQVRLEIATPADGSRVGGPRGQVFIAGEALAVFGIYRNFDIVFVVDTSQSTGDPAGGGDPDPKPAAPPSPADRILPRMNRPRHTILAAEIEAVRTLLGQLEPRTTRVAVISFAGDTDRQSADAITEVALTDDYTKVEAALEEIAKRPPRGLTNMVSAMNLALVELLGTESATSTPRADARRVVVFMTDGNPNPPELYQGDRGTREVLERVEKARAAGVRIDSYALGPEALEQPLVVVEMAAKTGGVFTPVVRPGDLRAVFEDLDLSELETLEIANRTTGNSASQLAHNADGSFRALLDLAEGPNRIEIRARASDGSQARRQLLVHYAPGSPPQVLDARQLAQRNRMLENELLELKRRNLEIAADRDAQLRAKLREEIARERSKAEEKAAAARKELEIEVEVERSQ